MKRSLFILILELIIFGPLFSYGQNKRPSSVLAPKSGQTGSASRVPTPALLPSQRLAAQAPAQSARTKNSCIMKSSRTTGSIDLVEILLEGVGSLDIVRTQGGKPEKTEVIAGFRYEERTEQYDRSSQTNLKSLRQYTQAGMKQKIGGKVVRTLLDASRKNVVSHYDGKQIDLYSPGGPLKGKQFLLLNDLPCNSLLLDLLLPERQVSLGDEWVVPSSDLAALLNLEAVENNTAKFTLTAIIDDIAEVDFFLEGLKDKSGKDLPSTLEGAFLGASVSVDLEGKYQFDLKRNRMSWLGVRFTEKRSESLVEPAIEMSAVLRVKIAPLSEPELLTNDIVSDINKKSEKADLRLFYDSENAPWSFVYGRNWRLIEDTPNSTSLCLVVKGEGVAQCNINVNQRVEQNKMPSLDYYKNELKKGLGDRFGKFVRDTKFVNDIGYLIYAVVVDGNFENEGYRWIYYLLTSPEGCQSSIMFEVRAEKLELFSDAGENIVNSFQMILPDSVLAEKAAAEEAAKEEEQKQAISNSGLGSATSQPVNENKPIPAAIDSLPEPDPKSEKEKKGEKEPFTDKPKK